MLYKKFLRKKVLHFKVTKNVNASTWAEHLGVEASYLSRFLSDDRTHFSDELLLKFAVLLQMKQTEIDHLNLLREYDRCTLTERKEHLLQLIRMNKFQRWVQEIGKMNLELDLISEKIESIKSLAPVPDVDWKSADLHPEALDLQSLES